MKQAQVSSTLFLFRHESDMANQDVPLVAHQIALCVSVELSSPGRGPGPRSIIYPGIDGP